MLFPKKRIRNYLDSIVKEEWSPFEIILEQYMSGQLLNTLAEYGISKLSCYIDFLDDYKCINVQGKHESYFIDIQIEQKEFSIGCDPVEPDDHKVYPFESPEYFYSVVSAEIRSIKSI